MSFRKIWTIARHEYLLNLKRPGFIIWTLTVPALGLIGLLLMTFLGGQAGAFLESQFIPESQQIGIVDRSGLFTPISENYADKFSAYDSRDAGVTAMQSDEIDSLVIVPENYLETADITVISAEGGMDFAVADDVDNFLSETLLVDNTSPEIANRVMHPSSPNVISLAEATGEEVAEEPESTMDGVGGLVLNMMVPYFLGILLVVTIFTASGYLLRGVSEEKTSRVIEIVLSSVNAQELLAGKVLGLGALGLTQISVWLLSAFALSGGVVGLLGIALPLLSRPMFFILSVVYYLLGFTIYAVLMGAGGALGTTQQESQQIAGMFSFMSALPLMLGGFIITSPNMLLARVLSWIPFTAPTMMMLRLSMGNTPTIDIIGSIVVTLLAVPFIIWAGAKIFRVGLLMYGKRPTVKEIWKLLREA